MSSTCIRSRAASSGRHRHVAHVLPLTSGARRKAAGAAYSAVAAVFIRKAMLDLPHPLETIANTFKLTPAEMRIVMMIVEVGGVPEVALALGVSETTVCICKASLPRPAPNVRPT